MAGTALVATGGCVQSWAPNPGVDANTYPVVAASCQQAAQGVSVDLPPPRRAAAQIGVLLAEAAISVATSGAQFNACMRSSGFHPDDGHPVAIAAAQPTPPAAAAPATIQASVGLIHPAIARVPAEPSMDAASVVIATRDCLWRVRDDPRFAGLQALMPDLGSGQFQLSQLVSDRPLTPGQATAYGRYAEAARRCSSWGYGQLARISPDLDARGRRLSEDSEENLLGLLHRSKTWGEYAQQHNRILAESGFDRR